MMVLLQYAVEDGPITLYDVWRRPIHETLALIEWMCQHTVVGFNLAFDWYHICKVYTIFRLCDPNWIPEEHIDEIAMLEPQGQDGPCIKPASCLDLMLHSRKGPFQSLMSRDDIRIKRVPSALSYALAQELESKVHLDNIYFAKSADADAPRWQAFDRKDAWGNIDVDFKDVVLRFNPAGGLKFLAEHALGYKPKFHFKNVEPPTSWRPQELGYAPTALAISTLEKGWAVAGETERSEIKYAWPGVIGKHIKHWATNENAREYATDDIVYTRALDKHFGFPEPGDDDSVLACMVSAVRWHGFKIDVLGVTQLLQGAKAVVSASPVNINKPSDVRAYVTAAMDETECIILEESTKKANLEAVAEWALTTAEPCTKCQGETPCATCDTCARCGGTGIVPIGRHPAAVRAKELLNVKIAAKEVELYEKLLKAGKFHASFIVIGALSSRMSGADGLNAQGIKHSKEVRRMFPLAWDGMVLSLGDFSSFEVTLADAVYNDEKLRTDLLSGKKIHTLFGQALSGLTYEEVTASKGTDADWYDKGKRGVFALLYGGDWNTLVQKLGIPTERAKTAYENFVSKYPGIEKARQKTFGAFCSMRQPGGLGSAVVWADPADYIETFLGFRRYFTLENKICKALFDLAHNVPPHWKKCKVKVVRRDRVQTAAGAVASALYGAAFQMQAANMRAAANHEIQSAGACITKAVQRKVWDLQPAGVNDWHVSPMNVHDEILCVTRPDCVEAVEKTVLEAVEGYRPQVPLIGIDWMKHANTWADK
jgi:hypothetical protein